jgi:hypothetical protein
MTRHTIRAVEADRSEPTWRGGYRDLAGTIAGALLIWVGAYLPWLRANPGYEPIGLVPSLMTPGVASVHFVLLSPAVVVVAARIGRGATRGLALATLVTGLWAVLFAGLLLGAQYTAGGLRFAPDVGWALTVGGGLALALVGGLALFESEAPSPR